MGLLSRLGRWQLDDGVSPTATASDALLSHVVLGGSADVAQVATLPLSVQQAFGLSPGDQVDRRTAMTIPAVRRGRGVIVETIGAQPLVAHRRQGDVVERIDRPLLEQPDPNTTRQYVLSWTVDDLLFHGVAWWRVTDRDDQGYPRHAEWIAKHRVRVDFLERRVYIDGEPAEDRDLIRFDGPDEGVLVYGGRTLRTCLLLEEAVRRLATLEVPTGTLETPEGGRPLNGAPGSGAAVSGIAGDPRSEVEVVLDLWSESRRTRSTGYLAGLVYKTHQFDAQQIGLHDARQHQAAEVARLLNLPPRYVNAPSASGMTYSNVESDRRDLVDTTLAGYIAALEQRLSLGDVTPRGTTVRVDLTQLLRGDTKTALEAADIAVRLKAMTSEEVRTDVLGRTPLSGGNE